MAAHSLPTVTFAASGATVKLDAEATFLIDRNATGQPPVPAFSLLGPGLKSTLKIGLTNDTGAVVIVGSVGDVNIKLKPGRSSFGTLGPAIIAALSAPLNQIVNAFVVPIANKIIAKGIPIPSIDQDIGTYHIKAGVSHPVLSLKQGYLLMETDMEVSLTPKTTTTAA